MKLLNSRILFWYTLKELLIPFIVCFSGFIVLFLIADVHDQLGDYTDKAPPLKILMYFLYLQPARLQLILPIALLLATIYCFSSLNRNNEIIAMRTAGMSLHVISMPVWVLSSLVTIMIFALGEGIVPKLANKTSIMRREMEGKKKKDLQLAFFYKGKTGDRHWVLNMSPTNDVSNVRILQLRKDQSPIKEINAKTANFHKKDGWEFKNAEVVFFNKNGVPKGIAKTYLFYLDKNIVESPKLIKQAQKTRAYLSMRQMNKRLNQNKNLSKREIRKLKSTISSQFFFPFSCFLAVLLGVPLSINSNRSSSTGSTIKGVGIMLLFYITSQFFVKLGFSGTLSPLLSGILPLIIFFSWGIHELFKKL